MVGGKWNQYHRRVDSMSLLNMALFCIRVRLGTSHLIIWLPPWVWVIPFDLSSALCLIIMTSDLLISNTAKSTVMPPICSREVDLCSFNLPLILIWSWFTNIIFLCLASMMWEKLWPTFDQGHFLVTSTHYPGRWSRDSLFVPWSLHASMAGSSHPMQGFHHWPSIRWFYRCSTLAHCSHSVDCTYSTLRAIAIIGGTSRIC